MLQKIVNLRKLFQLELGIPPSPPALKKTSLRTPLPPGEIPHGGFSQKKISYPITKVYTSIKFTSRELTLQEKSPPKNSSHRKMHPMRLRLRDHVML